MMGTFLLCFSTSQGIATQTAGSTALSQLPCPDSLPHSVRSFLPQSRRLHAMPGDVDAVPLHISGGLVDHGRRVSVFLADGKEGEACETLSCDHGDNFLE